MKQQTQMRWEQNNKFWSGEKALRIASYVSFGLFGVFGVVAFCPVGTNDVGAAVNTEVSVSNGSNISISIDPSVAMDVTVTDMGGKFVSGVADLTIATNSPNGYKVFMTSADAGETALRDLEEANNTRTIDSITTDTVGGSMTGNVWGYAISTNEISENSTFGPIPANANNAIYDKDSVSDATGDVYKLGFGAHVDPSLPAGTYTNSMVVSVVASPKPTTALGIFNMQEMTSDICSNMEMDVQYELEDVRDQKRYSIAKLKDGKCWMTQNLAYDFVSGAIVTPENTDVSAATTIPSDALNIGTSANGNSYSFVWKGSAVNGDYYSLCAATFCSAFGKFSGSESTSSVCPKGWKLPSRDEYSNLASGLTTATITQLPYNFVNSGYVVMRSGAPLMEAGYRGYYWTRTVSTVAPTGPLPEGTSPAWKSLAFDSLINFKDVYGAGSSGTLSGEAVSVRCIAK